MKKLFLIICLLISLGLAACGGNSATSSSSEEGSQQVKESSSGIPTRSVEDLSPDENGLVGPEPKLHIPKGPPPNTLVVKKLIEGEGPQAKPGDVVTIQYVGADYKTGETYDSSWNWTHPYVYKLGSEEVMKGLEQGIEDMAVGDRREFVIPPALANPDGSRGGIPEKEAVVYVVDLLAVE